MTATTPGRGSRWDRVRRGIADALAAQSVLWAAFERIDPDPDARLHWEPTTSGWRLFGSAAPPV